MYMSEHGENINENIYFSLYIGRYPHFIMASHEHQVCLNWSSLIDIPNGKKHA